MDLGRNGIEIGQEENRSKKYEETVTVLLKLRFNNLYKIQTDIFFTKTNYKFQTKVLSNFKLYSRFFEKHHKFLSTVRVVDFVT